MHGTATRRVSCPESVLGGRIPFGRGNVRHNHQTGRGVQRWERTGPGWSRGPNEHVGALYHVLGACVWSDGQRRKQEPDDSQTNKLF